MVLPWFLALTLTSLLAEPVVIAMTTSPYSVARQAISDLGVTTCGPVPALSGDIEVCSPGWPLMNAAMALTGMALTICAALLRRHLGISVGAVIALVVAGVSTIGAAAIPLNVSFAGHLVAAMPAFPAQAVAMILLAKSFGYRLGPRWRVAFLLGGTITALCTVLFVAPASWELPFGVIERIAAYTLPAALTAVALASNTTTADRGTPTRTRPRVD